MIKQLIDLVSLSISSDPLPALPALPTFPVSLCSLLSLQVCFLVCFWSCWTSTAQAQEASDEDIDWCAQINLAESFKSQFRMSIKLSDEQVQHWYGEEVCASNRLSMHNGKLMLSSNSHQQHLYFYSNLSDVIIHFDPVSLNCTPFHLDNSSPNALPVPPYMFADQQHKRLQIGPNALWSQILSNSAPFTYSGSSSWRLIPTIKCTKKMNQLFHLNNVVVEIHLEDPNWILTENSYKRQVIPLAFRVNHDNTHLSNILEVEYFLYEPIDTKDQHQKLVKFNLGPQPDLIWSIPEVACPSLQTQYRMPSIEKSLKMDINFLFQNNQEYFRLILDQASGLTKITNIFLGTTLLIDHQHQFFCRQDSLDEVYDWFVNEDHAQFVWSGQSVIEGLLCDVYQKVTTERWGTYVQTAHVHQMNVHLDSEQPVSVVKKLTFNKLLGPEVQVPAQPSGQRWIGSLEADIEIFQPLPQTTDWEKTFDFQSCFFNEHDSMTLNMKADWLDANGQRVDMQSIKSQEIMLRKAIKQAVREMANCSLINLANLDLSYDQDGLEFQIDIRNVQRMEAYFDKLDYHLNRADLQLFLSNLDICMYNSLNNPMVYGFSLCEFNLCYQVLDSKLFDKMQSAQDQIRDDDLKCQTYRKKQLDHNQVQVNYVHRMYGMILNTMQDHYNNYGWRLSDREFLVITSVHKHSNVVHSKHPQPYLILFKDKRINVARHSVVAYNEDCYAACEHNATETQECQTFSVCLKGIASVECYLSNRDANGLTSDKTTLVGDKRCTTYELSALNKYTLVPNSNYDALPVQRHQRTSVQQCAALCSANQLVNGNCSSFAMCDQFENIHDGKPLGTCFTYNHSYFESEEDIVPNDTCHLYQANFLMEFTKANFDQLDQMAFVGSVSEHRCALNCLLVQDCTRFLFCGESVYSLQNDFVPTPLNGDCYMEAKDRQTYSDTQASVNQSKLFGSVDVNDANCFVMRRRTTKKNVIIDKDASTDIVILSASDSVPIINYMWIPVVSMVIALIVTILINYTWNWSVRIGRTPSVSIKYKRHNDVVETRLN